MENASAESARVKTDGHYDDIVYSYVIAGMQS